MQLNSNTKVNFLITIVSCNQGNHSVVKTANRFLQCGGHFTSGGGGGGGGGQVTSCQTVPLIN